MSKEDVVLFAKAIVTKPVLNARVVGSGTMNDLIEIATDAGFEFTGDEFCSVLGEVIGKQVSIETAVSEYLSARERTNPFELTGRMFMQFIGGVARKCDVYGVK